MLVWSVFKEGVFPGEKQERRKGREETNLRLGHVTPSFLTDDEEEFQSNIDLVSLVCFSNSTSSSVRVTTELHEI